MSFIGTTEPPLPTVRLRRTGSVLECAKEGQ
jgi:hypothetical protein